MYVYFLFKFFQSVFLVFRDSEVAAVLQKIIEGEGINLDEPANVFVGQDTR